MKYLPILLSFQIFTLTISAQTQHTTGTVLDAVSREPVIAATIKIEGQSGFYLTDTLGQFRLPNHKNATITCTSIGYNNWSGQLPNQTKPAIILLEPAENALGAVVISATMKEVSKDASPIPVEIYTPRFFQKNATATIFEALTVVNGVRPQLNCNVCNTGEYNGDAAMAAHVIGASPKMVRAENSPGTMHSNPCYAC